MTVAERLDPFVGRATEVATLRAELAAARAGTPRVLVVQGDAGIGKTVLLEQFLTDEADLTVLRATGEQWEAYVAYGVIDQLMRVAGVSTTRLLVSRDRSFPPEEPVGVGAWILDVIKDLAQEATVVVIVDDAHWADMDSLRALLFAARRLGRRAGAARARPARRGRAAAPRGPAQARGRAHRASRSRCSRCRRRTCTSWPRRWACGASPRGPRSGCTPTPAATRSTSRPCSASCPRSGGARGTRRCPRRARSPAQVLRRLEAASPPTRGLVEAVAVLGTTAPVGAAATLAGVPDLFAALDEASVAGLLQVREDFGIREVGFPHPLVQAAVYEQLGPLRRMQLHSAAAEFVEDEGALLRHRVLAATPPNPELAAELEAFARREAAVGAWASAAWALVEGSNLSPNREAREQRLLLAVDATVGAGDLHQAEIFARDVASFSRGAWRDAALGYLAILRGRRDEAEELLGHAWRLSADDPDTSVAAVVAQRLALHAVGRLRGDEVVRWSTRAIELARPGDPVRVEAEALLGLGMGWQGQIAEGMTAYEELLGRVNAAEDGPQLERIRMAHGWLRLVRGDVVGARASLAMTAPAALRAGSVRIAVWSFSWLAYAEFVLGAWDEAAADAERAVSLLDESGMEWLRPLARYAAVLVPAARGEWEAAEEHLRAGAAQTGDYELMVVAAGLARAEVAAARGEHGGRAAGHGAGAGHRAAGRGRRAGVLAVAGPVRRSAGQRGQAGRGRGPARPARGAGGRRAGARP